MLAHAATRIGDECVAVVEHYAEARIGQNLFDSTLHFDEIFFRHLAPMVEVEGWRRSQQLVVGHHERSLIERVAHRLRFVCEAGQQAENPVVCASADGD